jgi:hypothetical protein
MDTDVKVILPVAKFVVSGTGTITADSKNIMSSLKLMVQARYAMRQVNARAFLNLQLVL